MKKSIACIAFAFLIGAFALPATGCLVRTERSSRGASKSRCKPGKVMVKKNGKYKCKKPKKRKETQR